MIELRTPHGLHAGCDVFVWWPDWFMRRATVIALQHLNVRSGRAKAPPEAECWRITVRMRDGEDAFVEQAIYRGNSELVPVLVKPAPEPLHHFDATRPQ